MRLFKFSVSRISSNSFALNLLSIYFNYSFKLYALFYSCFFVWVKSFNCFVFCYSDFFSASYFFVSPSIYFCKFFNEAFFSFIWASNYSFFSIKLFLIAYKPTLDFVIWVTYCYFSWIIFFKVFFYYYSRSILRSSPYKFFLKFDYLSNKDLPFNTYFSNS